MVVLSLLLALQSGSSDEEVGDGVVWRRSGGLHILEIDLARPDVKLQVAKAGAGTAKLSAFAAETKAIAAVNGTVFDATGNPLSMLRVAGKTYGTATAGCAAIGWTKEGKFEFKQVAAGADWTEVDQAIGGALLLDAGKAVDEDTTKEVRTVVGIGKEKLFLVVAPAMTCPELARAMKGMGCTSAFRLDGATGSSIWVRGKGPVTPAAERPVGSGLLILAKDVVVIDNAGPDFRISPATSWERAEAKKESLAQGEDYSIAKLGSPASAVWKVRVEFTAEYDVYVRWPVGAFTTNAHFKVVSGVEEQVMNANQSKDGGKWIKIGKFDFKPSGPSQQIELTCSDGKPLVADAVKLVQR
jgi:hypothetical protein